MSYYIATTLNTDFESAVEKVKESLQQEGFGVLTEIDMHEIMKKKLDVDFRKYKILGACNPPLAHRALQSEDKIGTMLPCNVVVQELDNNSTEVAAIDPYASMQRIDNKELKEIALTVKEKLATIISNLN